MSEQTVAAGATGSPNVTSSFGTIPFYMSCALYSATTGGSAEYPQATLLVSVSAAPYDLSATYDVNSVANDPTPYQEQQVDHINVNQFDVKDVTAAQTPQFQPPGAITAASGTVLVVQHGLTPNVAETITFQMYTDTGHSTCTLNAMVTTGA